MMCDEKEGKAGAIWSAWVGLSQHTHTVSLQTSRAHTHTHTHTYTHTHTHTHTHSSTDLLSKEWISRKNITLIS